MDSSVRKHLKWINLYEQIKDAGVVCLKCGISRPTLRKWLKRYKEGGVDALIDRSRKPMSSPRIKLTLTIAQTILEIRTQRKLGVRRIQSELNRLHGISLSLRTIHKVLKKHNMPALILQRHYRKHTKRYNCEIPGQRVQMDFCQISKNLFQYTAIDDCTRYKVIALYKEHTAANTLDFLDQVIERLPFPIQRIQTDRGTEFLAYEVQERFMQYCIKFRPIRPRSPHLNGKVERTQRTDLDEFYSMMDLTDPKLEEELAYWEFYYNWYRPHSSLKGKTPEEKYQELSKQTPLSEEVESLYDPTKERIIARNYKLDCIYKKLKRCL